jgi:peptidoglycan/xylan/chitin deacetylase (PgdA/CDA1 family)
MAGLAHISGKRETIARGLYWSGALALLGKLPPHDSLLVLTYHRIGDGDTDPWDPGVFSATGDQFDAQISFLKRKGLLVTLDEALEYVEGTYRDKSRRCRVLITFDDGCLDNYETAYPILRSHGAQGLFFLCSGLVGTGSVLWWDQIAYLIKASQKRQFSLNFPVSLNVDIDRDGLRRSLRNVFDLYERVDNKAPKRFLEELGDALEFRELPPESQRYMSWEQAREMLDGGMALGAHTHSHPRLSLLSEEQQRWELTHCRAVLQEKLGIRADTMAYPFGSPTAFSKVTKAIAEEVGYRVAFSYYGQITNEQGSIDRYDVKRVAVGRQSWPRFRAQAGMSRLTGRYWP